MTKTTAAARYARALLDVAKKEQADRAQIESQLAGFVLLLEQHEALSKALLNPAVPAPKKKSTVEAIVARLSLSPILGKLLVLLGEKDRLGLLPSLLESYRQRLLDEQGVVRAEVTTSEPITGDKTSAIQQTLARATGRTVELSTRVDPAIVGGLVAKVGGTVFDASVSGHLQRMKQRLEESI